jgi:hypothetical protein
VPDLLEYAHRAFPLPRSLHASNEAIPTPISDSEGGQLLDWDQPALRAAAWQVGWQRHSRRDSSQRRCAAQWTVRHGQGEGIVRRHGLSWCATWLTWIGRCNRGPEQPESQSRAHEAQRGR